MSEVWAAYVAKYGKKPATSKQLMSFSKKQADLPTLTFKTAKAVFAKGGEEASAASGASAVKKKAPSSTKKTRTRKAVKAKAATASATETTKAKAKPVEEKKEDPSPDSSATTAEAKPPAMAGRSRFSVSAAPPCPDCSGAMALVEYSTVKGDDVNVHCAVDKTTLGFCPNLNGDLCDTTKLYACVSHGKEHRKYCAECAPFLARLKDAKSSAAMDHLTCAQCSKKTKLTLGVGKADEVCPVSGDSIKEKADVFQCAAGEHSTCSSLLCGYILYQRTVHKCARKGGKSIDDLAKDPLYNVHFQCDNTDGTLVHHFAKVGQLKSLKQLMTAFGKERVDWLRRNPLGLTAVQCASKECSELLLALQFGQFEGVVPDELQQLVSTRDRAYGKAGTLSHFLKKSCADSDAKAIGASLSSGEKTMHAVFMEVLNDTLGRVIESKKTFSEELLLLALYQQKEVHGKKSIADTPLWKERVVPALRDLLTSDTLAKDTEGWTWFHDTLLRNPLWLEVVSQEDEEPVEEVKDDSVTDDVKKPPADDILFDDLKVIAEEQTDKLQTKLLKEMNALIEADKRAWIELTNYKFEGGASVVRQCLSKAKMTEDSLKLVTLDSAVGTFDALDLYENGTVLSDLLIGAHAVDVCFQKAVANAFDADVKVKKMSIRAGPVKKLSAARSKTIRGLREEAYPRSLSVLDLVRCTLTFKAFADLMEILKRLPTVVADIGKVVKIENGFIGLIADTPKVLTDVKVLVAINTPTGCAVPVVIGEISLLIEPMLEHKKATREFERIQETATLFEAAAETVKSARQDAIIASGKTMSSLATSIVHNTYPLGESVVENWTYLHECVKAYGGNSRALADILKTVPDSIVKSQVNIQDDCEKTPLMYAIETGVSIEVLKLLVRLDKASVDWTKRDAANNTYLHKLVQNVSEESGLVYRIALIPKERLDSLLNIKNDDENTPLHLAMTAGVSVKVLRKLIGDTKTVQWKEKNGKGLTYLNLGCENYVDGDSLEKVSAVWDLMSNAVVSQLFYNSFAFFDMLVNSVAWNVVKGLLSYVGTVDWDKLNPYLTRGSDNSTFLLWVCRNYAKDPNLMEILTTFPKAILNEIVDKKDFKKNSSLMELLSQKVVTLEVMQTLVDDASKIDWKHANLKQESYLPLLCVNCGEDLTQLTKLLDFVTKPTIIHIIHETSGLLDMFRNAVDWRSIKHVAAYVGLDAIMWDVVQGLASDKILHTVCSKYKEDIMDILKDILPAKFVATQMNLMDRSKRTPLMVLLEEKKVSMELLRRLVADKRAMDWTLTNESGQTYLSLICSNCGDDSALLKRMLKFVGLKVVFKMLYAGNGLLDIVKSGLSWPSVKSFLEHIGLAYIHWHKIENQRVEGSTLLHLACAAYEGEELQQLLSILPDALVNTQVNLEDSQKRTPLMVLFQRKKATPEVIKPLLRHENAIDWDKVGKNNDTYLNLMSSNCGDDVELLLKIYDCVGKDVVAYCFTNEHALLSLINAQTPWSVVSGLIGYMGSESIDWDRLPAGVMHAIFAKYPEDVSEILQTFPGSFLAKRVNSEDENGNTLLMTAIANAQNCFETVPLLIGDGKVVDWKKKTKEDVSYSVLICRSCEGDVKLLKKMLDLIGKATMSKSFNETGAMMDTQTQSV